MALFTQHTAEEFDILFREQSDDDELKYRLP